LRELAFPSANARDSGIGKSVCDAEALPKWFAVSTMPRHEKRIAQHFDVRQVEFFLPVYRSNRRWNDGSHVTLDLPLFPGYIFARVGRRERSRVLQIPGVLSLVAGTGREPASLSESEICALRSGLAERRAEPHPLLTVGQKARIRSGALTGMSGVVVRMKGALRVVLTLELIMQSIAVEVDSGDLEPVAA
jgi:transcription antitermination factor NusG